jgi:outer membrane protein assembly factor BamB
VISGWDGRIFVPTEKKISCYTASGTLLWRHQFEANINITPTLNQKGGIILSLDNNEIWQFDPFGGNQKWMPQFPEKSNVVVLLSLNTAPVLALHRDGSLELFGAAKNHSLPTLPAAPIAAISKGNEIAVLLVDGRVCFISIDEGKILWTGDSHIREIISRGSRAELQAEMIFDERGIYILSINGATGVTKDGRRLWYTELQNAASIPAFGDDGVLYSGGADWIFYAYRMEYRELPQRFFVYLPTGESSYGTGRPFSSFSTDFPTNEQDITSWLHQIKTAIDTGTVETNELLFTSHLMTIISGKFHIQHKINALNLLGRIGSRETIPWLVNQFRKETESLLKTQIAGAIGAIGSDPEGTAIRMFLETVLSDLQDEQLLISITSATAALCRFSGPPLSTTGIRILSILSANQFPTVRQRAQQELTSLR